MLISIVTINRNNSEGLLKTIQSVVSQSWQPLEYIVIDGASTDGSVSILDQYASKIHRWVSEPDKGVYHAQNKGWKMAKGKYVLFLNSGDWFCSSHAIAQLASGCTGKNSIVYGDLQVEKEGGSYWLKTYPDQLPNNYFDYETLPHPATLIAKILLEKYDGYDESLAICSDWKFFRTVFIEQTGLFTHISKPISFFQSGGLSSKPGNGLLIEAEKQKVKEGGKKELNIYRNALKKIDSIIRNK